MGGSQFIKSKFVRSVVAATALALGAASLSTAAYADAPENNNLNPDSSSVLLVDHISSTFNTVSGKCVDFSDLRTAFEEVAKDKLGFFERSAARSQINDFEFAASQQSMPGLQVERDADGNMTISICGDYVRDQLVNAVENGAADGHEDAMKRISQTAAEAIAKSPAVAQPEKAPVQIASNQALKM